MLSTIAVGYAATVMGGIDFTARSRNMNTLRWFLTEYRHEDEQNRYYLQNIVKIWMSGLRYGFIAGLLPLIVWWILR